MINILNIVTRRSTDLELHSRWISPFIVNLIVRHGVAPDQFSTNKKKKKEEEIVTNERNRNAVVRSKSKVTHTR